MLSYANSVTLSTFHLFRAIFELDTLFLRRQGYYWGTLLCPSHTTLPKWFLTALSLLKHNIQLDLRRKKPLILGVFLYLILLSYLTITAQSKTIWSSGMANTLFCITEHIRCDPMPTHVGSWVFLSILHCHYRSEWWWLMISLTITKRRTLHIAKSLFILSMLSVRMCTCN